MNSCIHWAMLPPSGEVWRLGASAQLYSLGVTVLPRGHSRAEA